MYAAPQPHAAGCPSPRVWYEFLVSFDNRWPRVMIAITVHGSKNIYLLYVIMQRTYTVHILVTKSNSGEAGNADGPRRQSQLMRRTLTINNFFLIVWCFFPVCTRAARFFQRLRIVRRRSGAAAAATPPPRRVGDIAGGSNHTWVKRGTNFFINEKRLKIWNPKANKTTARLKSLFRLEGCAMSPSE